MSPHKATVTGGFGGGARPGGSVGGWGASAAPLPSQHCGPPWASLGLCGRPWASLGFCGPLWASLGLPGPLLCRLTSRQARGKGPRMPGCSGLETGEKTLHTSVTRSHLGPRSEGQRKPGKRLSCSVGVAPGPSREGPSLQPGPRWLSLSHLGVKKGSAFLNG